MCRFHHERTQQKLDIISNKSYSRSVSHFNHISKMTTKQLFIALALSVPFVVAQETPQAQPTTTPAVSEQTITLAPLKQDAKIVCGQLANGFKYIIRPTSEPAGRASMRLYVGTGSLDENKTTSGLSHLIEHLVFNGSTHFKRGELIPAMQKLGLGFGGDANAYTSLDHTLYMLNLPNLKEETVDFSFTMLRDFADGATLSDEAIDHERGIVISELHARDSHSYRGMIATLRQLCNGTRIPDFLPIGLEEVIRDCPGELVRAYYRSNYIPRRMTLIITGDFDPKQMEELTKKHFSSIKDPGFLPRPEVGKPVNLGPDEMIVLNPEKGISSMAISIVDHWQDKEDTIEQRIKDMPLSAAIAMLNQRLSRMTRKADNPFIAAAADEAGMFSSANVFALSINCEPQNWAKAMTAAEQELRRACEFGFSDKELDTIIASTMAAAKQRIETSDTITCDAMAQTIVNKIKDKHALTDAEEDARATIAGLQALKQNPDAARQALKKAYDTQRAKLSISGAIAPDVTKEALRRVYQESLALPVTAPEEDKLAPFAYDKIGTPGKITQQNTLEDLDITTLTLSNGVRVNLKSVDFRKNSVNVSVRIDGGSRLLHHIPGLNTLTEYLMKQGGLEAHPAEDLARILAGRNVSIGFGCETDRFLFGGSCTPDEIELQCQLLIAGIMHPGFRNDGEIFLRRALPSVYNKMRTTPEGAFTQQSSPLIYGNDPRFSFPKEQDWAAINGQMVKNILTPALASGAMEVSIVGDFEIDKVLPILERTFGAMPARKAEFTPMTDEERKVTFQPWGQRNYLRYPTELDKTLVTFICHAGDGQDYHRNRRLSILNSIVREKVFDGIRAELGETYTPIVRTNTQEDFSKAATVTITCTGVKDNTRKISAAMEIILQKLATDEGITEEDFVRAIRPIITRTEKNLRTPEYWAGVLADLQSDPANAELARDIMNDLKSITVDEIRQIAKEIFSQPFSVFYTVPEDFETPQQ